MLQFPNNYKFNAGNELNENFGINLYETFYRLQDVQTGRFLNADPYAEKYFGLTPYNYAANNPVSINDPLGDQMKYPGDNGRMQKGPDGNYHTGWVGEMMWNEKGFFNYGEVYGFSGGDFGSSHALYNIRGMSSQSYLNQKQSLGDNAIWDVAKGQFGYWRIRSFDPINKGYQEAEAYSDKLQEVAVGTGKEWVAFDQSSEGIKTWYQAGDEAGQLFNVGAVVYGGAEIGIQLIRKSNGPQIIGRTLGFGTQRTAAALRGTLGIVGKVGKYLGVAGYAIQVATISYKVINGERVSTSQVVGFGVSTALVGAAAMAAGTLAAPFVAGAALIYGAIELGSWLYNGKTLEDNIFGE